MTAPPYPSLAPRERLVARLREAAHVPVVLVVAPAGYGKTTLLREWTAQDARPCAWASPVEGDGGPSNLLAAADGATAPLVLVLDEVERLRTGALLDALLARIARLPAGSQLVLAGRRPPPLPIGRLRAHRRLFELRTADLAMTRAEAVALLERAGLPLARDEVDVLVRRTEGWPAALYLAALCVRDQDDRAGAIARFGGDDRLVADYLEDELLAGLDPGQRELLVRTASLDRLSGPLCDAVLEATGSGRDLAGLARAGLLLPLDRTATWHRRHPLLRDLLLAELRRTEPQLEAPAHRRAGAWHAAHGDVDRAIHHAVAGGAVAEAGRLLWAHAGTRVAAGRNAAVARWLAELGPEHIADSAPLALTAALSELAAGEPDRSEHWTRAAATALTAAPPGDDDASLRAGVVALRAASGRDGLARMTRDAERAVALDGPAQPWRPLCRLLEGVGRHLRGESAEARALLDEGARRSAVGAPLVHALCLAQLALLAVEREDWHEGAQLSARAHAPLASIPHLDAYPAAALAFAVAADVRAHRGRIEEAEHDARHAALLLDGPGELAPWHEAETRVALASASLRLSDVAEARRRLREATHVLRGEPDAPVLHRWIDRLWTLAGDAAGGGWSLTTAELRVLQLLPTYLSFPDIAQRLFVSPNTVKTHARAVYRKLDASSRAEAVLHAREAGLLDVPEAA